MRLAVIQIIYQTDDSEVIKRFYRLTLLFSIADLTKSILYFSTTLACKVDRPYIYL